MEKIRRLPYEKWLSNIAILYFLFGLVFALYFAWYYHWEWYGYFSPNFFLVLLSWPFQAYNGFIADISYFGPYGKPI